MAFSQDILKWYDQNRRDLPWRDSLDPYHIWLSEIMLQQTQTETVKGYYARFLDRFPTVSARAGAQEEEVLKLWEGLGYYSRARNLYAAAKRVAFELGGRFPMNAEGLKKLPGIGPYAANAIASIAYGECAPALDGNQARVLSRILAYEPVIKTPFDLLEPAMKMISCERPGDYNQALMDLGATLCTPKRPSCDRCPVANHCAAFKADAVEDFPHKAPPIPKREENWSILLLVRQGRLLIRRRPKGLLGGLYQFYAVEGHLDAAPLTALLEAQGFTGARVLRKLPPSRHVFTHLVWHMEGWLLACDAAPEGFIAVDADALNGFPFPSALRVYREIAGEVLSATPSAAQP